MTKLDNYVSRLSKYYTIYGQCASARCPKYRFNVSDGLDVSLAMEGKDIVLSIFCRIRSWENLKDVHALLDRLYELGIEDVVVIAAGAQVEDVAEQLKESSVFGGK